MLGLINTDTLDFHCRACPTEHPEASIPGNPEMRLDILHIAPLRHWCVIDILSGERRLNCRRSADFCMM